MSQARVPLFVRLPREQAAALDRLVGATGRHKQQVVSELLAHRLADSGGSGSPDVLTLEEAAALLRVSLDAVRESAERGGLPGRQVGGEWRFGRAAVLAWLATPEEAR